MSQDMAKISVILSSHNATQLPIRFSIIKIQFSMIYSANVFGVCAWVFRSVAFGILWMAIRHLSATIPFSALSLSSFEYDCTRHTHTHTYTLTYPWSRCRLNEKLMIIYVVTPTMSKEYGAEDAKKNTNHIFHHPQRSNTPLRNIQMAHGNGVCVCVCVLGVSMACERKL